MQEDLFHLLKKHIEGNISPSEKARLSELLDQPENREKLSELLDQQLRNGGFQEEEDGDLLASILENITGRMTREPTPNVVAVKRISLLRQGWAAAAIFIFVASVYILYTRTNTDQKRIESSTAAVPEKTDFAPGGNKALLRLGDGSEIILDNAQNGILAIQGDASVVKLKDGQLSYNAEEGDASEIMFNTIETPRGGQYALLLPDGSKVWLNAASSLRFPTSFRTGRREVELKGEGYFEIAHDEQHPFIVNSSDLAVHVLGTRFNVNAYQDETDIRATLLEGKVSLSARNQAVELVPGEQAVVTRSGNLKVEEGVDLEGVMAWKNGRFHFKSVQISVILRQAARWYDMEVEYLETIPDRFTGEISRDVNASELLKILELTGKVKFQIDGKKVKVST